MRVKEKSGKAGLKLNFQKAKIIASSPITSWQVDGEKSRNSDRFYFLGLPDHCEWWLAAMELKGACSLEEKI